VGADAISILEPVDPATPAPGIEIASNGAAHTRVRGRTDLRPAPALQPPPTTLPSLPRRGSGLLLIGMAALLGAGALALGTWTFAHQHRASSPPRPAPVDVTAPLRRAVGVLASPRSVRLPLNGSVGRLVLVVDEQGRALLVVRNLGAPPAGKAYQVWVIPPGRRPVADVRFAGGARVALLRRRVVHGGRVAVTLERPGVRTPTRRLRLVTRSQP
jgi:anti-sigma-K factor RskA